LNIINDILDFSKLEAGKITLEHVEFSLREAIDDVLTMLAPTAHEKNLEIIPLIHADLPVNITSDPLRFRQVISNLVNNAIKFTEQGTILIEAVLQNPATLQICITDTGIGLSEQQRKDLFNAFTQANNLANRQGKGTGLGLTISKHLIERMGGMIDLDSNPGEGSKFWFTIPLGACFEKSKTMLAGNRILYFDDHPTARQALIHFLNFYEMTGDTTETLDQFVEKAVELNAQYDAVIIGLNQPERISMVQITHINNLHLPVIFLLNSTDPAIIARLKQQDLVECQPKPISHAKLYNSLCSNLTSTDTPPQTRLSNEPFEFGNMRVLAVDDNEANLKLVCALLDDLGVDVTAATNGSDAVTLANQSRFDLIFMDVQMPGMNGIEATERIHSLNISEQHTPVVALTAHAFTDEIEHLLNSGMDDYIIKPIDEFYLRAMLLKWVRFDEAKSAKSEPSDPIVDWELAYRLAGGKKELAEEMLNMLLSTLPNDLAQIKAAFDSDNLVSLKDAVHRLNGATRYCGVPGLQSIVKDLETLIKQEKQDRLEDAMNQLCLEVDSLQTWAAANLASTSVPNNS